MNKGHNHFLSNILHGFKHRIKKTLHNKNKKAGLNWLKIKQLKHLPYNSPHTFYFRGSKISFNNGPELLHSLQEIFIDDIYKIAFDTPSPYILDCGANIGLSVIFHKFRYPAAKIIAFEPDPVNFNFLAKNISEFGFKDVELRNEAVWKENGTLTFTSDGTLGSKLFPASENRNVVNVKATRLKDLLNTKIDFLKIDIEGAEYEVLKDCGDSLRMVQHLFIEFHGYFNRMNELTEIIQLVQDNGFAYYIKEATNVYDTPFWRQGAERMYDLQQNIFCFRITR